MKFALCDPHPYFKELTTVEKVVWVLVVFVLHVLEVGIDEDLLNVGHGTQIVYD